MKSPNPDILKFQKLYSVMKERHVLRIDVVKEMKISEPTLSTILAYTGKDESFKINSSTLAIIQDFNKKYHKVLEYDDFIPAFAMKRKISIKKKPVKIGKKLSPDLYVNNDKLVMFDNGMIKDTTEQERINAWNAFFKSVEITKSLCPPGFKLEMKIVLA